MLTSYIVAEQPEARQRLAALLREWLEVDSRRGTGGTAEHDEETIEQLRALGYLGGTDGEGGEGL